MRRLLSMAAAVPGVVMIAPAPVQGALVYLHEADAAHAMFPQSTAWERKTLELRDADVAALEKTLGKRVNARTYSYLAVRADQHALGFIFELDVIGESQPITFAVGVSSDGLLQDLQVMVYREPRGEEIQDRRFRRQFVGKRAKDPLTLGKDIDAISGATISSRSATFAARKALALTEILRLKPTPEPKP